MSEVINKTTSLINLLRLYLGNLIERNLSKATVRNYRSDINQFIETTQATSPADLVDQTKISQFFTTQKEKGLKTSSITRKLISLEQFSQWLAEQGQLESANISEKVSAQTRGVPITLSEKKTKISLPKLPKLGFQKLLPYFNLAMVFLFFIGLGYFGYNQLSKQPPEIAAFPSTLTRPGRVLSFQGRLTNTNGAPITSNTAASFRLYNALTGGTQLWSGSCNVIPDSDGIFSVTLGSGCGSEISSNVFSENANIWLEIEVAGETLAPRQPIATVGYALNSETLQGFPPALVAEESTVLVMNVDGDVVLGSTSPVLKSTTGTFTIEGQSVLLQTTSGSGGNITLNPDGAGDVYFHGSTYNFSDTGDLTIGGRITFENSEYVSNESDDIIALVGAGGSDNTDLYINLDGSRPVLYSNTDDTIEINDKLYVNQSISSDGSINAINGALQTDGTDRITEGGNLDNIGTTEFNGVTYTWPGSDGTNTYVLQTNGSGTLSWVAQSGSGGGSLFRSSSGAFSPINDTVDVLFGGSASSSAKFNFLNVNTGTPVASVSANSGNNATYLSGGGVLGTTNSQTLTIGGLTSGDILFQPNGDTGDYFRLTSDGTNLSLATTDGSNLTINPAGNLILNATSSLVFSGFDCTGNSNGGTLTADASGVITCSDDDNTAGDNFLRLSSGAFSTVNDTADFLVGSNATASAKFAVLNVDDNAVGIPTASVSAGTSGGAYLMATGNLRTTARQSLTLGGSTTGNIAFYPDGEINDFLTLTSDGNDLTFGTGGGANIILDPDSSSSVFFHGTTYQLSNGGDLTLGGRVTFENGEYVSNETDDLVIFQGVAGADNTDLYFDLDGTSPVIYSNTDSLVTIDDALTVTGNINASSAINANGGSVTRDSGNLTLSTTTSGNVVLTTAGNIVFTGFNCSGNANGGALTTDASGVVSCSDDDSGGGSGGSLFRSLSGAFSPINDTVDILFGSTATSSARFAFINVDTNSPNAPTASISAGTAGATYLTANGNLATTAQQTLRIGGATTGRIQLQPNSDTTNYLELSSNATNLTLATTDAASLIINPDSTGDIFFHGSTYNLSDTGDLTLGGRTTFENSEYISNETDDLITFQGVAGSDNTDLTIDLDGTHPVIRSINDLTVEIDDILTVTGNINASSAINANGGSVTRDSGNLTLSTTTSGNLVLTTAGNLVFTGFDCTSNLNGGTLTADGSGNISCADDADTNQWRLASGALSPTNDTVDVLIGSNATASAKFAFLNVNSGTPTASISANSGDNATFLTGTGNLATTNGQTLTIGGASTGDILLQPNGDTGDYFRLTSDGTDLSLTTTDGSNLTISPAANLYFFNTNNSIDSSGNLTVAGAINANGGSVTRDSGNLTLSTTTSGNLILTTAGNLVFTGFDCTGNTNNGKLTADASGVISCADDGGSDGFWREVSGAISPLNDTYDVLIGSNATASAKFAFLNVNTGTPTASISANSGNIATYLTGTGNLATTNAQTLTIGSSSTGDIALAPAGSTALTIQSGGRIGIGTTTPDYLLEQVGTITDTSGTVYGNLSTFTLDPSGSSTAAIHGERISVETAADADDFATAIALAPRLFHYGTGTITDARGNNLVLANQSSGTITSGIGGNFTIRNDASGGTINSAFAGYFSVNNVSGATMDNAYGAYLNFDNAGTITTGYGLYIDDVEGSTAYGFYSAGTNDYNYLAGRLGIGADTTPEGRFEVDGAATGQALVQLNETGDQDIFTASASGTTRFRIGTDGYTHSQRFVDIANAAYFLDPAATDTSLTVAGRVGIGTTSLTTDGLQIDTANTAGANGTAPLVLNRIYGDVGDYQDIVFGGGNGNAANRAGIIRSYANAGGESALGFFTQTGAGDAADHEAVRIQGDGDVGIGTTTIGAKLHVLETTEQLRLGYDASNYASFTVASDGGLTLAGTGTDADVTINPGGSFILSDLDCTGNTNGGALTADASGVVSCSDDDGSSTVNFSAGKSASQNIGSGATTKVTFNTEEFDNGGVFDSTTNSRFQPQSAAQEGYYILHAEVRMTGSASGGNSTLLLYKNGAFYKRGSMDIYDNSSFDNSSEVTAVVHATTSDYYEVFWENSTAATDTLGSGAYFDGARLSPSGADLAEFYLTYDLDLEPGELVATDLDHDISVTRADGTQSKTVIGAVSTMPGTTLGSPDGTTAGVKTSITGQEVASGEAKAVPVALEGRVPVRVSLENGEINRGDALTLSSTPGVAMKATQKSNIVGYALENFADHSRGIGKVMVFVKPGLFEPETSVETAQNNSNLNLDMFGELVLATSLDDVASASALIDDGKSFFVIRNTMGEAVDSLSAFSKSIIASLQAGFIDARYIATSMLEVRRSITAPEAQIAELQTDLISPLSGNDVTIKLGKDTHESSTSAGINSALRIQNSEGKQVASIDSQGLIRANNASLSGEVRAQSARVEQLTSRIAQLEHVRAQTADIVTATISGTLYANDIYQLDEKIARAFEKPNLLSALLGKDNSATSSAEPGTTTNEVTSILANLGYSPEAGVASSSGSLRRSLTSLNLDVDDVVLTASATFINDYFDVNGSAYIADSLGVGSQILVGQGMRIGNGVIEYLPVSNTSSAGENLAQDSTLFIQPSGRGSISILAGLLTLDESGLAYIDGDLTVAGNLAVNGQTKTNTLLTSLLEPTNFTEPLQIKIATRSALPGSVAGATADESELIESRFEIVGDKSTPVATVSARGQANFEGALGATDLSLDIEDNNPNSGEPITTGKTLGVATIKAGTSELTIYNPKITSNTLMYATPLGPAGNQTLYVKQRIPEDKDKDGVEGKFVVGFYEPVNEDVSFNWWIINDN